MYNRDKILKDLYEAKEELNTMIATVEKLEKELKGFYVRGYQQPGRRARKILKTVMEEIKILRTDILRLSKERKIFETSEIGADYE